MSESDVCILFNLLLQKAITATAGLKEVNIKARLLLENLHANLYLRESGK